MMEMAQLHFPVVVIERVKFNVLELAQPLLIDVVVAAQELAQPVMMMDVVVAKERTQL